MSPIQDLVHKVNKYKSTIQNTIEYRKQWEDGTKEEIKKFLNQVIEETKLPATIELRAGMANLESIVFSLGVEPSGIFERVGQEFKKNLYKSNGMLIFQQLFNGKIVILIAYPHIEEIAEPKPPKNIEIIRPDELTSEFMLRYVDTFLNEIIEWEDFDDNLPHKIGFNSGFQNNGLVV